VDHYVDKGIEELGRILPSSGAKRGVTDPLVANEEKREPTLYNSRKILL